MNDSRASVDHPVSGRTLRTRVLIVLFFVQVLTGLGHGVTYSLGALLASDLAGDMFGGAASTVTTLGAALWAIPLARLVDRYGRKVSLSSAMLLGMCGAFSCFLGAQFRLFALVLVGFFFIGAAVAMNLQARFAAADVAGTTTRGRDISIVVWATTIGAVAGPNLFDATEKLGAQLGLARFSGAYLVCIAAQFCAATLIVCFMPALKHPTIASATAQSASTEDEQKTTQGKSRLGIVAPISTNAMSHFAMTSLMSMTAVHMHGHGASMVLIGITISAHVAGMYGFSPLFGLIADKAGAHVSVAVGLGLNLAAAALLVGWDDNENVVVVSLLLLGLGWSATLVGTSSQITAITSTLRRGEAARIQGRSDVSMNVMGAMGGIVAGPVVSSLGMPVMASVVIVLLLAHRCALHLSTSTTRHKQAQN